MKKLLPSVLFFLFLLSCIPGKGQTPLKSDSIRARLALAKTDTGKATLLSALAFTYENTNPDSAINITRRALKLSRSAHWSKGLERAQYALGIFLDMQGDKKSALAYMDSSLKLCLASRDTERLAAVYNVLGNIYSEESQFSKALDYYYKAMTFDSLRDKRSLADVYNNIGLVYESQGNYARGVEFYFKALKIYEKINHADGLAASYTNLGNVYATQHDNDKAEEYHRKALEIDLKHNRMGAVALDYSNLGTVAMAKHDYAKALDYLYRALELDQKLGLKDNQSIVYANIAQTLVGLYEHSPAKTDFSYTCLGKPRSIKYNALLDSGFHYNQLAYQLGTEVNSLMNQLVAFKNLGGIFHLRNNPSEAIRYYKKAHALADSAGALNEKLEVAEGLAEELIKDKQFKEASDYLQEVIVLKDSLNQQERNKALGKQEAQFDYDKKLFAQQQADEKKQMLADAQSAHQRFVSICLTIGFGAVLVFLVLLYKRFRITTSQKQIIENQKKEVDGAYAKLNDTHLLLREKDKDLTDSISYARRIQTAILPPVDEIRESFPESFVLFKPKDIVSGDFYWLGEKQGMTFIAACDCTGHGVPGGFMSMIGTEKLNASLAQSTDVSRILNLVNINLKRALRQSGKEDSTRDGMDIALCSFDKTSNQLIYSGANRPLWIIKAKSPNEILETKPTKVAIGGLTPDSQEFGKHSFHLEKGDTVYLFSDGFADQFGYTNKKLMSRNFKEVILSMQQKSMQEQSLHLDSFFESWKSDREQTDDVLVVAFRI